MKLYSTCINGFFNGGNFIIKSNTIVFYVLSDNNIAYNYLYSACQLTLLLLHFRYSIVIS
jgi:hypothetical protein